MFVAKTRVDAEISILQVFILSEKPHCQGEGSAIYRSRGSSNDERTLDTVTCEGFRGDYRSNDRARGCARGRFRDSSHPSDASSSLKATSGQAGMHFLCFQSGRTSRPWSGVGRHGRRRYCHVSTEHKWAHCIRRTGVQTMILRRRNIPTSR